MQRRCRRPRPGRSPGSPRPSTGRRRSNAPRRSSDPPAGPRRPRLARIHEVAVLGMAGGGGSFLVVGFFFGLGHWGPLVSVITKASLAALAVTTVSCVATIYTVAMIFDTDPRTVREMREAG